MTELDHIATIPLQNLEAEASELGAILLENEAISRALEILKPEEFYRVFTSKDLPRNDGIIRPP